MASVTIGGPVLSTEPGGLQPGRSHDWTWDLGGSTMRAVSVAVDPLTNNTVLAVGNLRFVVAYAKRYRCHGVSVLDLIHEGNLGLIEAARRFDPTRNVKFITYAVWWVRESMMHVLSDQTRAVSFPPKLFSSLGHGGEVFE